MNTLNKVRVLIVDDNSDLADAYVNLLKTLGFSVAAAADGKIAWDILQTTDFDIVLSDIKMPVMDGVALLEKIRARDRLVPCVLITSGFTDYPPDVLFQMGANGFLSKPVGAASIRDALNRTFLKPEDLWSKPPAAAVTERFSKRFESFADMLASREVQFGNGGFCLRQNNPAAPVNSVIHFIFTFQKHEPFEKIEGMGVVRWVHVVDSENRKKGIGVEFKYLADGCRVAFCDWIRASKLSPFIPIQ